MEMKSFNFITLEKKGKTCILKLNRPEKKNAMSEVMRAEIIEALEILKDEKKIRTVILYGGEDFFCAGFDRDEVQAMLGGENWNRFIVSSSLFHRTFLEFPKLLIAAVNGYALAGGFDLTVLCHLRLASGSAVFGHPEIGFGACPLFFPYMALVGRGKALELTLDTSTKDTFINAEEAYRLNIVNKLVESENVLDEALKIARRINKSPEFAVEQLLQVSNSFFDRYDAFETEMNTIVEKMKKMLKL
jgi:enoyl-CoA hydratase/carnithine racemase